MKLFKQKFLIICILYDIFVYQEKIYIFNQIRCYKKEQFYLRSTFFYSIPSNISYPSPSCSTKSHRVYLLGRDCFVKKRYNYSLKEQTRKISQIYLKIFKTNA